MDEFEVVGSELNDQESQESGLSSVLRNLTRGGVRVGETLAGTPGDIANLLSNIANFGIESATGYRPLPEEIPFIPTTENVKQVINPLLSKILPKDYLEPQTPTESGIDEFIQDVTGILHPIGGPIKSARVLKALTTSGLGNLAKLGAESIGLGKEGAGIVKAGTMLLSSIGYGPRLKTTADNLYKIAEKELPIGKNLSALPVQKWRDKVLKIIDRPGTQTPSKEFLSKTLIDVDNIINPISKKIPAEGAYQFIKDINENFREGKIPSGAIKYSGELINDFKKVLFPLKKTNPTFYNAFTEGSDIYKALNTSSRVNGFIQNNIDSIRKNIKKPLTAYMFGIPKTVGGAAIAEGVKEGFNKLDQLFRSPTIRSIYRKAIESAIKENIGPTARYISQLDKAIGKEFPEESEFEVVKIQAPSNESEFEVVELK